MNLIRNHLNKIKLRLKISRNVSRILSTLLQNFKEVEAPVEHEQAQESKAKSTKPLKALDANVCRPRTQRIPHLKRGGYKGR